MWVNLDTGLGAGERATNPAFLYFPKINTVYG